MSNHLFFNVARDLRKHGIFVPGHIPDRAVIPVDGIECIYRSVESVGSMLPVTILADVRINYDKFTWEPYRRPTNARPLVSRAKREGLYCGKHKKPNIDFDPFKEANPSPVGHRRVGYDNCAVPLRHRKDYVATTVEEVHSILDKIIAKGTS